MPLGRRIADWAFGNDPANSARDRIRIMVGDTDEDLALVSNKAIDWRLSQTSDENEVAARVCEDIAAWASKYVSKSAKDYSESLGDVVKAYKERATDFRARSASSIPTAPQLRHSTRRNLRNDTDLVQPQFHVGMLSEDTIPIDSTPLPEDVEDLVGGV